VVRDAGDVLMYAGDVLRSIEALEEAVYTVAKAGAIPVVLGGDHTIALPDARGVARVALQRQLGEWVCASAVAAEAGLVLASAAPG
jgi:arginase family enzyme